MANKPDLEKSSKVIAFIIDVFLGYIFFIFWYAGVAPIAGFEIGENNVGNNKEIIVILNILAFIAVYLIPVFVIFIFRKLKTTPGNFLMNTKNIQIKNIKILNYFLKLVGVILGAYGFIVLVVVAISFLLIFAVTIYAYLTGDIKTI